MVIAIIPLIIAVIGLLMYALAANPKVQEAGRLVFFAGIFVLTWVFAKQTVSIG